jgi:hypothetical protein
VRDPQPYQNSDVTVAGIDNLTPWQPGQSGNPGGRPRTKQVRDALQKLVNELGLEPAVKAIYAKASEGDVSAFREIADRLDGKVTDNVHTTGDVTINVTTGVPRAESD